MTIKAEAIIVEVIFRNDEIINGKLIDKDNNVFLTVNEDEKMPGHFINGKLTGRIKI